MTILKDQMAYFVIKESEKHGITIYDELVFSEDAAADFVRDGDSDVKFQVIELNIVEGNSRDITEDIFRLIANEGNMRIGRYYFEDGCIIWKEHDDSDPHDPNEEHRLGFHNT